MNRVLFELSLRGLGILNYENDTVSGERKFLQLFSIWMADPVVLDVGANIGNYASLIKALMPEATVYAFEPHPGTFERLHQRALAGGYKSFNLGCSDAEGILRLYDYEGKNGSSHASMYRSVIEDIRKSRSECLDVRVTTVDSFVSAEAIQRVNLLKIDTEGHELKVLQGALLTLHNQMVDVIHFEFNEMNAVSRVFFKDFIDLLPEYYFFRMLPDGLYRLRQYSPLEHELFGFQNIVAIHQSCGLLNYV